MTPVAFLIAAVVVALVASVIVVVRHRRRPSSYDELDDFARQMRALAPERPRDDVPRGRGR